MFYDSRNVFWKKNLVHWDVFGPKMFAYWSHKYAYISETVHLRHFMTMYEYHHHFIAFDLGYLYLTLNDLRRSNQGQIGENHSKWLITLVLHFRIKICLLWVLRIPKTLLKNKQFLCGLTHSFIEWANLTWSQMGDLF